MESSREKLYELFSAGVAGEITLRVTGAAPGVVKSRKTPIRRLAATNLALPRCRELKARILPHVKDVVNIMTQW